MIRYTVNSRTSLLNMPFYVTSLTVTENTCNEDILTILDLSPFKLLKSVVIGDNCFKYTLLFSIEGLNWLESVTISSSSFTEDCDDYSIQGSRFRIINCPRLKSLSIGRCSFSQYNGFELAQLPQLQTISIGSDYYFNTGSVCFGGTTEAIIKGEDNCD